MNLTNKQNMKTKLLMLFIALAITTGVYGQLLEKKHQATPPQTQYFGKDAFEPIDNTIIRWLGNAGFFINSRGTTIMLDPLLVGFDMPILIDMPIKPAEVPHLDAVLITHSDNDHFSIPTCVAIASVTDKFHSTLYVDSLMKVQGFTSFGHKIDSSFCVNQLSVRLTPADHAWQNHFPGAKRVFKSEDFCGFWIDSPDGTIWAPGDSRLLPEHLTMETPDVIFFDFSDSRWHFSLEGALKIAEAYPETPLVLCHWGTVDAPDMSEFNGDPEILKKRIVNPERVFILAAGEPFRLRRIGDK